MVIIGGGFIVPRRMRLTACVVLVAGFIRLHAAFRTSMLVTAAGLNELAVAVR